MLWDADISPIGITEQVRFLNTPQFELSLIAGQFNFNDNPENAFHDGNGRATKTANVSGGAYLAYQQIPGVFKVNNNVSVSAAGGYLFYPGLGGTAAAAPPLAATGNGILSPSSGNAGAGRGAGNGQGQAANVLQNSAAFNSANAERNLSIGTFNGDVKLGLAKNLQLKLYGQAAYNFKGATRRSTPTAPSPATPPPSVSTAPRTSSRFPPASRPARTTRSRRTATSCSSRNTGRSASARWTRTSTTPTGTSAAWASAASRSRRATGSTRD